MELYKLLNKRIFFILSFFLVLTSVSAIIITIPSNNSPIHWEIRSITGNESILYKVKLNENQVVLTPKSEFPITRQECESKENKDFSYKLFNCKNVTYYYPNNIPIKDRNGNILTIKNSVTDVNTKGDYIIDLDYSITNQYRIGLGTIVIDGSAGYNPNQTLNVTLEQQSQVPQRGVAHLNVSITPPYDELVLYYPFDGDKENTANAKAIDFSTNNSDGTLQGTTRVNKTNCIYGDCLQLDGTNNGFVAVGGNDEEDVDWFVAGDNFTVSFWMYINSTDSQRIQKYDSFNGRGYGFFINNATGEQLRLLTWSGGIVKFVQNSTLSSSYLNSWHHVAGVRNQSDGGQLLLYFDGVFVGNTTEGIRDISAVGSITKIGCSYAFVAVNCVNGNLDEFMIFKEALSQNDISDIYNNQSARFFPRGEMTFYNIDLGTNNTANVTIERCQNSHYIKIGNSSEQLLNGCSTNDFSLAGIPTLDNTNLTIIYYPSENNFMTPVTIGNITINERLIIPTLNIIKISPSSTGVPYIYLGKKISFSRGLYVKIGEELK